MEEKSKNMEENLERTEGQKEEAGGSPKAVEERAEDAGENTKSVAEKAEGAGKPGEALADKIQNKGADAKSRINRKKVAGWIEVAAAVILIVLSGRLFLNTRGTRLLYVSVMMGRVSRYFWILGLAAVACGVTGVITLRSKKTR